MRTNTHFGSALVFIAIAMSVSLIAPALAAPQEASAGTPSTAELYRQHCSACHEGGVLKAPHSVTFQMIGPDTILKSMTEGVMQREAATLTMEEKRRLAEFLGGSSLGSAEKIAPVRCGEEAPEPDPREAGGVADWGFTAGNTRFVPADRAGLTRDEVPRLALKWAFAYPNATRARSQPTVSGNTVFMGSQDGTIYALNLASGCVRWTYMADAEVRSALTVDSTADADGTVRVYFGDFIGQVYALNAGSGELLWKSSVADHPNVTITGSPKLHGDRLYVPLSSTEWASAADPAYPCCTFRGGIAAFETANGRMAWKSHTIPERPQQTGDKNPAGAARWAPAGAPVWGSLTIDAKRKLVYAGTGQAYTSPAASTSDSIIAFDLEDGEMKWVYQATAGDAWNMSCFIGQADNCPAEDGPDFDFGAPPVLLTLDNGRDVLLAGQKSGHVHALDPDRNGALLWKIRIGLGGFAGGVHWGMAAHDGVLYAPNADTDFIGKWEGERKPGLFALDAETGEEIWFAPAPQTCAEEKRPACDPGLSAAVTAIPGVVFAGAFDGHLRAYDSGTGEVIWDFNTAREFDTLSGESARGGSIESDGPVVADGQVLVNSGYLFGGRMGGNLLLAFSVDGE